MQMQTTNGVETGLPTEEVQFLQVWLPRSLEKVDFFHRIENFWKYCIKRLENQIFIVLSNSLVCEYFLWCENILEIKLPCCVRRPVFPVSEGRFVGILDHATSVEPSSSCGSIDHFWFRLYLLLYLGCISFCRYEQASFHIVVEHHEQSYRRRTDGRGWSGRW